MCSMDSSVDFSCTIYSKSVLLIYLLYYCDVSIVADTYVKEKAILFVIFVSLSIFDYIFWEYAITDIYV